MEKNYKKIKEEILNNNTDIRLLLFLLEFEREKREDSKKKIERKEKNLKKLLDLCSCCSCWNLHSQMCYWVEIKSEFQDLI